MKPILEVRNLEIAFTGEGGHRVVVEDVDFEIGRGELLALVGESGSGKSLTALSLLGLLPKSATIGIDTRITLDGTDITRLPPAAMRALRGARIAMIFQDPLASLNPVMRIGDQIIEAITAHGDTTRSAARSRAIDLLAEVRIADPMARVDAWPHQLSGGMRQRAMIAIALAAGPELLIADEPTTALDTTIQAQILGLLDELRRSRGLSILLISHDLGLVAGRADRVMVMQDGRLVETAPADRLFASPAHPHTRALLAAVARIDRGPPPRTAQQAGEPLVTVDGLVKNYTMRRGLLSQSRTLRAVDGVSLTLARGEILGLVGESGSGKTTLGRTMLRLEEPTSGTVSIDGTDISTIDGAELRKFRRRMQLVFQDPSGSLNPGRTVADSIADGLVIHGIVAPNERRPRVAALLEEVGLDPALGNRYPRQLSGGQRQRIGIARALAVEPEFLICDEAVSSLDPAVQAQVLELLLGLRERRGLAYLFITHDLAVVRQVADRIAVMYRGSIVEVGPAAQMIESPRHYYTRALVAAAPRLD